MASARKKPALFDEADGRDEDAASFDKANNSSRPSARSRARGHAFADVCRVFVPDADPNPNPNPNAPIDNQNGQDAEAEEEADGGEGEGEEVHGEYERDASEGSVFSRKSFLSSLKIEDHLNFLAMAPITRGDALRNMSPHDRIIFEVIVLLTPILLISKIWQFAQKSAQWLWARTARLTGSHTSIAVGHQRGTPIMKGPYESIHFKFKGNKASMWGSGKEVYATQCYVNDFKRVVTTVFREQRRSGEIQATMQDGEHDGYFIFRNQKIPIMDINDEPAVEVRHYGLLIDPWNHHRGVSPDGVVFINGVAAGVLEVKCAYAQDKSLYVNIKPYYIDQIMSELYLCHIYWPETHWVDFVVWAPQNFTVDTFTFDAPYYFGWYAPRELKYYFRLYLKTLSEKIYHMAQQKANTITPSLDDFRRVAEQEFVMPEAPPPPPPRPPSPQFDPQSGTGESAPPHDLGEIDPAWQQQLLSMDLDF